MIRRAQARDRAQLEAVYDVCFPGEEAFRAWFFDRVWKAENTLVWEEKDKIISCLQDIPVELAKGEYLYSAHYIYAAGTLPEARGRGIMGCLLNRAFEEGIARGQFFSALITQNKSLFDFYRPFGYTTVSMVGTTEVKASELPDGWQVRPARKADFAAIDCIYRAETGDALVFRRGNGYYSTMLDLYGDSFVVLLDRAKTVKAYAFIGEKKETLLLSEAMGPEKLLLGGALGFDAGLPAVLQGIANGKENQFPLGCVKALTAEAQSVLDKLDSTPYLNIMFN